MIDAPLIQPCKHVLPLPSGSAHLLEPIHLPLTWYDLHTGPGASGVAAQSHFT